MARRKKRGASFANRKQVQADVEIKKQEQNKILMYSAAGLVALLLLCGIIYLNFRLPADTSADDATTTETTTTEGSAATESDAMASDDGTALEPSADGVADTAPADRNDIYDAYPDLVIDESKSYEAVVKTEKGDMRFALFTQETPKTVNNFAFLAQQGFYNDTMFHRVIDGFMAQAGDPTGTGMGGPGYQFEDEVDNDLAFDKRGLLAMANAGPATNGSQFFITYGPTPHLTGLHTIFGELIEGDDVLSSIRIRDPQESEPGDLIQSIEIVEK